MHFYRKIENMTGVTSGVGAACHSGTPTIAPWAFNFFYSFSAIVNFLCSIIWTIVSCCFLSFFM
jgi:hypothetical protein